MQISSDLDRLTELLFSFSRLMRKEAVCGASGDMSMLQLSSLFLIAEHEHMTMKELADRLRITSPSATALVNRLEQLQWVERKRDMRNRKLVRVQLSAAGRQMLHGKMDQKFASLRRILSVLTEQDVARLAEIFERVLSAHSLRDHGR